MSAVDVLAVMYAEIANAESLAVSDAYQAERLPKLREARASVAELIEAVKYERETWRNEGKNPGWIGRVETAKARTNAALARVQGGQS